MTEPTACPTEAALLAAIRAEPTDDTCRAVYADYIREQGRAAYADFIETQLELARTSDCGHRPGRDVAWWTRHVACPRCRLWQATVRFLQEDPAARPLRRLPWGVAARRGVERGFLAAVYTRPELWVAHGDAVLAAHPVERVELSAPPRYTRVRDTQHFNLEERNCSDERYTLTGDPAGRGYTREELNEVLRDLLPQLPHALLTLRWPRVTFTFQISTYLPDDEEDTHAQ